MVHFPPSHPPHLKKYLEEQIMAFHGKSFKHKALVNLLILTLYLYWGPSVILAADPYSQNIWARASSSEKGFSINLEELVSVVPKDSIPAILNPQFERGIAAEKEMQADEAVIGLSINGESKAYSTYILSAHEIVNDRVGGIPIAITW
jgi:hypothetical protein